MSFRSLVASVLTILVSACAQAGGVPQQAFASEPWLQTKATLPDGGPPVDADGFYDGVGSCPGEGCDLVPWHIMREPVSLLAEPNRTATVITTLSTGEWVRAVETVHRWRPSRGVVVGEVRDLQGEDMRLAIGDVIYTIDYEGEGWQTFWRRGETFSAQDPTGIHWDAHEEAQYAADRAGGGGWWIQVTRENGQVGWMLGEHLSCYANDLTPECAERNRRGQ